MAQHAIMQATRLRFLTNDIEVESDARREMTGGYFLQLVEWMVPAIVGLMFTIFGSLKLYGVLRALRRQRQADFPVRLRT